ncbi:unnamed protein product [Calypogeia fissa]
MGEVDLLGDSLSFKMGPTFFFLGMCSFILNWAVSTLGLPCYWWTYFILPCFSVFFLCDHQKLSTEIVRELTKPFRGMAILVAVLVAAFSSLYMGILPLKMVIPLVCIFLLVRGFSFENMMFIGDECGELAKFVWWRVVLRLVPFRINKMRWKGDWAYCSPYSRGPVRKDVESYYFLSEKKSEKARNPGPFELNFGIEDCNVLCKYFVVRISEIDSPSGAEVPETREEPTPCKDDQGASSSQSQSVAEASSSQIVVSREARRQKLAHKVEVTLSLQDGGEELESFTFFPKDVDRIAEIKRAMVVLKESQNVIFSSFHKNISSRHPKAHARCYDFKEIFELILSKGYTLEKVNLTKLHTCSISGRGLLRIILKILHLGVLGCMNYYQLVSSTPHAMLIVVLSLFMFLQLLSILMEFFVENMKRCLYSLISRIFQAEKTRDIYRYLQRNWPSLTFGNESYGYPYTQDCSVICRFFDGDGIPVLSVREQNFPLVNNLNDYEHNYNLRNLGLELKVFGSGEEGGKLLVTVIMRWTTDQELYYNNHFEVEDPQKISNLIGMLQWLQANQCLGICKKWLDRTVMQAFPYKELICKTLDDNTDDEPRLVILRRTVTVTVE